MEQIRERARSVGEERIRQGEAEWSELMAQVQNEMDRGTDPADPRVQEFAGRWKGLVEEFTGGDPGIAAALRSMWQNEPIIHGMDTSPMQAMGEYVDRALKASKPSG
jgi:hypothetical protein